MKKLTIGLSVFYIIVMGFSMTSLLLSCGPSKEELEAKRMEVAVNTSTGKSTVTLSNKFDGSTQSSYCYVGSNGCDYVATPGAHYYELNFTHDGQCRKCKAENIRLMDSIVKSNLKEILGGCTLKKK